MILIALGSNLPFCSRAPSQTLDLALGALNRLAAVSSVSSYYASPAWPNHDDPMFVNAVARIDTAMGPEGLLHALHGLEAGFGRRRTSRNGPRTLDLDLIAYNGQVRLPDAKSPLALPHPGVSRRDFVLAPLAEIAAAWRHPQSGLSATVMLAALGPSKTVRIREKV